MKKSLINWITSVIVKKLKKEKGIYIARPREIELENGKVSLQGFPKEVADALTHHLRSFGKPQETVLEPVQTVETVIKNIVDTSSLSEKAIGVRHNKETNRYELVTLAYNGITHEASVENVQVVGESKREAVMSFKRAAVEMKFGV